MVGQEGVKDVFSQMGVYHKALPINGKVHGEVWNKEMGQEGVADCEDFSQGGCYDGFFVLSTATIFAAAT